MTGIHMFKWLTQLHKTRYIFDLILLLFFILAAAPQTTGIAVHEWVSFLYLVPFAIHLLLHWDWIIAVPKRLFSRLGTEHRFNVIWDSLLYILMLVVTLSGILVSEVAMPVLGIDIAPDGFWSMLHHQSSNLIMPILGIHLAVHWQWIVKISKKLFDRKKAKTAIIVSAGGIQ
jgi:hypothetical protein